LFFIRITIKPCGGLLGCQIEKLNKEYGLAMYQRCKSSHSLDALSKIQMTVKAIDSLL
jgi:hypothetical protein